MSLHLNLAAWPGRRVLLCREMHTAGCPAGQAVANALDLTHRFNPGRRVPVPPPLLAAFPRLAEAVNGLRPAKMWLYVQSSFEFSRLAPSFLVPSVSPHAWLFSPQRLSTTFLSSRKGSPPAYG